MSPPRITRRAFVAASAALPLLAQSSGLEHFAPAEAALLQAICDRIIPADQDPGATEARVLHYLDRQLAGPLLRFAPAYHDGLARFDPACRQATGASFLELDDARRTRFLEQVEQHNTAGLAPFFSMLIDHSMQGFYGSPEHGGNAHAASWRMLGIETQMHEGAHGDHR